MYGVVQSINTDASALMAPPVTADMQCPDNEGLFYRSQLIILCVPDGNNIDLLFFVSAWLLK